MRTVTKQGHASWGDLKGKKVSFPWSDGWEDWERDMTFERTSPYHEDPRYPRYYVLGEDGGYSFWEDEAVEVTVHD